MNSKFKLLEKVFVNTTEIKGYGYIKHILKSKENSYIIKMDNYNFDMFFLEYEIQKINLSQ